MEKGGQGRCVIGKCEKKKNWFLIVLYEEKMFMKLCAWIIITVV